MARPARHGKRHPHLFGSAQETDGSRYSCGASKAANSVRVAASRWAFSRRYLRFWHPRPRLSSALIFPLIASTTPSGTLIWQ